MWDLAKHSITLFLRGKLFQDTSMVVRRTAIGVSLTAVILVAAVAAGVPAWGASVIAGLIGGMAQPYLFKDLKYR